MFTELDSKIKHCEEWSTAFGKDLSDVRAKQAKLRGAADKVDETIRGHIQITEERKTNTKRLEQIDKWINELEEDIKTAKSSNDEFTGNIKEAADRLRCNAKELDERRDHFKVLESAKFVLGDEGVKTHIIKKLIDLLNTKLTSYIRKLDGNCICRFNEYFEEEIINTKNKVRSYFNFSGAEKKAVDLGCLFAFSDIKRMQGGVSYNVSMYDELFDSSLDETGVNLVIDVLQDRVEENNECVMIISHRKEAIKAVTGEIIFLEKSGDITRRVDFKEGKL
jgi:DNA repair exonuclease SbcCD ATPase subunit